MRPRVESSLLVVALLLCAAFLVSLILGLRGDAPPPVTESVERPAVTVPDGSAGRVEVLNASGRGGIARNVTEQLRAAGFDVVFFGNATLRDSSVVLARTRSDDAARSAARRLGIDLIRTQADSTLLLDATVVIGKDWIEQTEPAAAVAEKGFWARVRDWIR